MKKIITLLSIFLSVATFAADFGWGDSDTLQINKGMSTTLTANIDTSLQMSFDSGSKVSSFGFYKYDANNSIVMLGASEKFSAGDKIGIWIENNGETLFSSHDLNGNVTYDGWVLNSDKDLLSFGFELSGKPYNGNDNLDVIFKVTTGSPSPAGQPLPGVFASILVSGLVLSAFVYKRKKSGK